MEHHIEAVVPVRPIATLNHRVGDAERAAACDELAGHFAAGRLTGDELNQRLEVAMAAQTVRDLRLVLADLPVTPSPVPPRPVPTAAGPRSGWGTVDGLVLVVLLGSAMVIAIMMLGLAVAGQVAVFLFAVVGGSLAALTGACLLHLMRRSR